MNRLRLLFLSVLLVLWNEALTNGIEPTATELWPGRDEGTVANNMMSLPAPKAARDAVTSAFKPNILSRDAWGATKPVSEMKEHEPCYLTVHHTATSQNPKVPISQKMRSLQQFSQNDAQLATGRFKPSWADVPYHFYIDMNGEIAEGRDAKCVGDTNTPYDPTGHIQIVLEGNFEKEEPSARQLQSLEQLAVWLSLIWEISPSEVKGHKDYVATACPGKNLQMKLPELREKAVRVLENAKGLTERLMESKGSGKEP